MHQQQRLCARDVEHVLAKGPEFYFTDDPPQQDPHATGVYAVLISGLLQAEV
jgi:hypothetical protein